MCTVLLLQTGSTRCVKLQGKFAIDIVFPILLQRINCHKFDSHNISKYIRIRGKYDRLNFFCMLNLHKITGLLSDGTVLTICHSYKV